MGRRPYIPQRTESKVLLDSRRCCAICYGLYKDLGIKSGQIAHLDRDPANNAIENLAFLCLEHHDDYDRPASQSKRLQATEVAQYRSELTSALTVSQSADPVLVLARALALSREEESGLQNILSEPDIPDELLRNSLVRYANVLANDPTERYRRIHRDGRLLVSAVRYTHFHSGLLAEQAAIGSEIERHSAQAVVQVSDGGFQRAVHEEAARKSKIVCVFPFFLVPSRRRIWGVLPFGWQTRVAIVLHRKHPAAIEWKQQEILASRIASDPVVFPPETTQEWLERLILHTESLGGAAYGVQGYVQFEILLEVAQHRGEGRVAEALVRTNTAVDTLVSATGRLQEGQTRDRSFFVIDPAEIRTVCEGLSDEFQVVTCTHDVSVPVGIGFSLPSSPLLLRNGLWRRVLVAAAGQYGKYAQELEPLGIRLEKRVT